MVEVAGVNSEVEEIEEEDVTVEVTYYILS